MTRRAPLLLLLAAIAAGPGCCSCGSPTFTVRNGAARDPGAAPALGARSARVTHFGDFGEDTCQQENVAGALAAAHQRAPFDLGFAVGDNIYQCGPDPTLAGAEGCLFDASDNAVTAGYAPPDDPLFTSHHEGVLAPLARDPAVPIYLALGNHDVAAAGGCAVEGLDATTLGRRRACLEVARDTPLWRMPGRHYVVDQGRARFIVVDSNLVKGPYGGFSFDDEVRFVAEAAAGCADRVCFLVGHHPPVTAGGHRSDGTPEYLARMDRLVAAGGGAIRAWLAGHDHDLQHLRTPGGLDVFVSGNGARGRANENFDRASGGASVLFASVRWGFGVLEVMDGGWSYRFEGVDGAPVYCCAAAGDGPCEPVRCDGAR